MRSYDSNSLNGEIKKGIIKALYNRKILTDSHFQRLMKELAKKQ